MRPTHHSPSRGFHRYLMIGLILSSLLYSALSSAAEILPKTPPPTAAKRPQFAYLVSDLRIPFWAIMARGIQSRAAALGYEVTVYSADNSAKRELELTAQAISQRVDGLIISPTHSLACVTLLKLAQQANIPVVIADIGTDGGEYLSYIASDNRDGAYRLGQILARTLQQRGWERGKVGIIAIPQKRANGQARTAGFMQALEEAGIQGGGMRQQVDFSYQETYTHAQDLIAANPDLRALWLQGSDRYQGALDAISKAGKSGQILLLTFDAEPEFLKLIPQGVLLAAGMQQPFLIGEEAINTLDAHRHNQPVVKSRQLPVLAVSTETIAQQLPTIERNVLGLTGK